MVLFRKAFSTLALIGAAAAKSADDDTLTPVVLWHGMGDNCCNDFSMGAINTTIHSAANARGKRIFVYSIMQGSSPSRDTLEGFLGNSNQQVESACAQLKGLPELKKGFNAVGFSQGGQFLRAYVQRCNDPPVKNLITMGSQHFGVADIPGCVHTADKTMCKTMAYLLGKGAYLPGIRDVSIQAQYFRAPLDKERYVMDNIFLPDINNERPHSNSQKYKDNLISLEKFVLIKFTQDSIVVPRESSWFSYYQWGSLEKFEKYNETQLYKEDWIGLRTLDEAGKLTFKEAPFDHMRFTMDYFEKHVVEPYFVGSSATTEEEGNNRGTKDDDSSSISINKEGSIYV